MNSLSFCLFGQIFIAPSFLESFTGYRILGWQLFSFSILNMPFHSLQDWKFLLRNMSMVKWEFPYMQLFSLLLLISIFFVFGFWQFHHSMSQWGPIQVQSIWGLLGLMALGVHLPPHGSFQPLLLSLLLKLPECEYCFFSLCSIIFLGFLHSFSFIFLFPPLNSL